MIIHLAFNILILVPFSPSYFFCHNFLLLIFSSVIFKIFCRFLFSFYAISYNFLSLPLVSLYVIFCSLFNVKTYLKMFSLFSTLNFSLFSFQVVFSSPPPRGILGLENKIIIQTLNCLWKYIFHCLYVNPWNTQGWTGCPINMGSELDRVSQ